MITQGALSIPAVGIGTYLCSDEVARVSVAHALKVGYRHIDTAEYYANHKGIAAAIAESDIDRRDIFITDKLSPGGLFGQPGKTFETTQLSMKNTLTQLNCGYIDLYLIHHAGAREQRLEQWRALVALQQEGLVRHIGVSNYSISHLEEIKFQCFSFSISHISMCLSIRILSLLSKFLTSHFMSAAEITYYQASGLPLPAANQIELHPLCTQTALITYLRENNIMPIAYSSLAPLSTWRTGENQASAKTSQHTKHLEAVRTIAVKYDVSEAQLLLKWSLQHNYPILPKSSDVKRIEQNIDIFHFTIGADDMSALDGLDENLALAWPVGNPLQFD